MDSVADIAIIGPGRVGTALGVLAVRAGRTVSAVAGRDASRAAAAAERIGGSAGACSVRQAAGSAGLVLLTVPDDAIPGVCGELADARAFAPGAVVAHCSGALASEVLSPARDRCGCLIGSIHPLQTFPDIDSAVAHLPGAFCFCEGDSSAVAALSQLADAVGARPVPIAAAAKPLYHAAAVTACNYLVALMDAAAAMVGAAGVDRTTWLLAVGAIVRATLENVARLGPSGALTGPIARGDVGTVAGHVEALAACEPALRGLFAAAGLYTVDLAAGAGRIDDPTAEKLKETLKRLETQE